MGRKPTIVTCEAASMQPLCLCSLSIALVCSAAVAPAPASGAAELLARWDRANRLAPALSATPDEADWLEGMRKKLADGGALDAEETARLRSRVDQRETAAVRSMSAEYRHRVFRVFGRQGMETSRRRRVWNEVYASWLAAGALSHEQPKLLDWLESATPYGTADEAWPLPDRPRFAGAAESSPGDGPRVEVNAGELAARIVGWNVKLRELESRLYRRQTWTVQCIEPLVAELKASLIWRDDLALMRAVLMDSGRSGFVDLESPWFAVATLRLKIEEVRGQATAPGYSGTDAQRLAELDRLARLSAAVASLRSRVR